MNVKTGIKYLADATLKKLVEKRYKCDEKKQNIIIFRFFIFL